MKLSVQPNQTIYDVAINQFGHIMGLFDVCKANGLSYSSIIDAGTELQISSLQQLPEGEVKYSQPQRTAPVFGLVEPGQNIYDMAVVLFGSVEGVFDICRNNNVSFSGIIAPGTTLVVNGTVRDRNIRNYFAPLRKPATGQQPVIDNIPQYEGIDYWAIEVDFIVSPNGPVQDELLIG
jgi:LysM repeat protein